MGKVAVILLALLLSHAIFTVTGAVSDDTPLNEVPFLMTHDSGSGYLGRGIVNRWTATQSVGLRGQLDCGARAFDARPAMDAKLGLVWHHGDVTVDYQFNQSVADIVDWARGNTSELVLLPISDCTGDGCSEAVEAALDAAGVPTVTDCSVLENMTLKAAQAMAQLEGGGMVLAMLSSGGADGTACSMGNYDSTLGCSGFYRTAPEIDACFAEQDIVPQAPASQIAAPAMSALVACLQSAGVDAASAKKYTCYADDATSDYPMGRTLAHLDEVAAAGPPSSGFMWQLQALWQETVATVALGTLAGSSLIIDEERSLLNARLMQEVLAGRWSSINFLEVNEVCDGGLELLAALRA